MVHVSLYTRKKGVCLFAIAMAMLYFGFWWYFRLNNLPGLHGDEAWAGLKANEFLLRGFDDWYGMNTYTGILQPLLDVASFKVMGIGVYQLRIPTVCLNLLGLMFICMEFFKRKQYRLLLFFLLFFSQSALFLVTPRIAWEVNTLTLFFFSLLLIAFMRVRVASFHSQPFPTVLFLIVNILGTYNHILFSSISVAVLLGIVMWGLYHKALKIDRLLCILLCNVFNLILLFILMHNYGQTLLMQRLYVLPGLLVLLPVFELLWLHYVWKNRTVELPPRLFKYGHQVVWFAVFILLINFFVYHGIALFDVLSNYKILTHVYSYPFPAPMKFIFLLCGMVTFLYFLHFLINDIVFQKRGSLLALVMVAYMGILALYTTNCSFRYYLLLYILMAIYLAKGMSRFTKTILPLAFSWIVMFISVNGALYQTFYHSNQSLNAIDFMIGAKQEETSAHFLPNKPLIDFLQKHQIGHIRYLSNRYFLEQPLLFYKLVKPWVECPEHTAIIDYDYLGNKGGYMLYYEK